MATLYAKVTAKPARQSAGQDAQLYGRRDARRYAKQTPAFGRHWVNNPRAIKRTGDGAEQTIDAPNRTRYVLRTAQ
jgi:hypothetical protein